ncbi:MAG TPA: hypothetical protein VEK15_07030 [Vicinamibacteria bacterium]|nr:hypothetical protein [Vicinamibacteria bacterium]
MKKALGCVVGAWIAVSVDAATLHRETLRAFDRYVELTERRIEDELESDDGFLVQDFLPPAQAEEAGRVVSEGDVYTAKLVTTDGDGSPIDVPDGMVHHWVGGVFVPGVGLDELVRWIQDYDEHHRYFDEVEASRLVSHDGDEFSIYLRLRRKKIVTVYYNTEHTVRFRRQAEGRVTSRSYSTRIAELAAAGTEAEREKSIAEDRGFLWRLNSYWRFKEEDGGVLVECESVSLSRSVPLGFRWIVGRYLDSVPRESLRATLAPIRDAHESIGNEE